ncbi:periplasmic chaperone for outer membrane proteins SurA [Brevirhabdus pacifica]|uniref:peptidylprolyl isomerase n=1 Tax=Brevirhabdus pacifica TaxID=1267768 RepID=UPI000CCB0B18|nr:peptidylprolyl isomerase [Brevirhabdus pacifica]PJJ87371.1 periplasmic chaperone for outer membrane proteins SurA [Brevirhabdus pacifica]
MKLKHILAAALALTVGPAFLSDPVLTGAPATAPAALSESGAALAGPFSPVITVDGRAITEYELSQRIRFLTLLRTPGDPAEEARTTLINERLYELAAQRAKITVTDEELRTGMEEFAGRANLALPQFLQAIGSGGISEETFRAFVRAGLLWRNVVRARFGPRAAQVDERDISNLINLAPSSAGARVLLSELVLPATPETAAQSQALAERLQREIKSEVAFARAAREFSVSPTAGRGGKLEWIPLANLPPALAPVILSLSPGQVSPPVPVTNAIVLFQLRALDEVDGGLPKGVKVDYAVLSVAGTDPAQAQAAVMQVARSADTCNDLYGLVKGRPGMKLVRETRAMSQVPNDIGIQLARLDADESSVALTRDGGRTRTLVMLCERIVSEADDARKTEVRGALVNRRLGTLAENYLAELRAQAIIVEK